MARLVSRLTARQVETARAEDRPLLLADGRGLYLRVWQAGSRSWIFRYQMNGQRHDLGLGSYPDVTLGMARERAMAQRRVRLDGSDPLAARQKERQDAAVAVAKTVPSFRECAERYIAAHRAGWKSAKHAAQWEATLAAYAYPVFGGLPVDAIDVGLVMQAIGPIWATKPETAGRLRGRIESVLDWAAALKHRSSENPARWKGNIESLLPKKSKVRRVEHHAALSYGELRAFMGELRQQEGVAAKALEFAILTAARTGEVLGATWSEIDLEARLWTVSGGRMKGGKEHRVPLSAASMAVLEGMRAIAQSDYVFPGFATGRPLSNMALLMLLRRMSRGDLTAHGFRSTFSDWCAEQTNFPADVREMALAHVVGDKTEAAYRRGDLYAKRRQLADAWGNYCGGEPAARVVRLRARG